MADIDLKALGIEKAFPRLAALQEEIRDFGQQVAQANNEVRRLESALEVARGEDVAAQAKALRSGKAVPKTTKEDKVKRELETAQRNAAMLQRAVEDAQGELGEHMAKHRATISQAVDEVENQAARRLRRHANAAATIYGFLADLHYVKKALAPPPSAPDESAPPGNSVHFIGVQTRQTGGPERGNVEAILAYLASLAPPSEEDSDAA